MNKEKIIYIDNMLEEQAHKVNIWDEVKHTLLFITLYLVSFSVWQLSSAYIDLAYPNNQIVGLSSSFPKYTIRLFLSVLITSYPLFAILFLVVTKQIMVNPALRHIKSRIWLTYLTIVGSSVILIGDLIYMCNSLLNGFYTVPFFLRFLTVMVIYGTIVSYYLSQIIQDHKYHA